MNGLERRVKDYPLAAAMIIVLLGTLLGTVAGSLFALDAVRSITKAADPSDPLDMLSFVAFGYVAIGFCGGAVAGLMLAIIVYFANKQRGSQSLSN
jgi:hypothetical protein